MSKFVVRLAIVLSVLGFLPGAAAPLHAGPTAGSNLGLTRYRVSINVFPGEDATQVAQQVAATYRSRLESSAEADAGFVMAMTDAEAQLMSSSPRVISMRAIGIQPDDTGSTWSTGTYSYDGSGNVKAIGADVFRYDKLGRIRKGTAGAGRSQEYTYDAAGNILTVTTDGSASPDLTLCVDPATNQIDKSSQTCNAIGSYDVEGNMTSYLGTQSFAYDGLSMVRESTIDNVRRLYLYTPNDERIASIAMLGSSEASSEWTLRDGGGKVLRRLQRSSGSWAWKEDYIYRGTALLAAEMPGPERTLHFHADHLGTPRLITGSGGAEISRHTYYPFGREATSTGQDTELAKFTGHERDSANLDYMHARYYMPYGGRFLSVDPMSGDPRAPQTWNRYSYAFNNPLAYTDPDGRCAFVVNGSLSFDNSSYCVEVSASDPDSTKAGQAATENSAFWESTLMRDALKEINAAGEFAARPITNVWAGLMNDDPRQIGTGYVEQGLLAAGYGFLRSALNQNTAHGRGRLRGDRGESRWTREEINETKGGKTLYQRDGATVHVHEVTPGRYNVIVEGDRGVVTSFRNLSEKSLQRLANNYGWMEF